jgi:hypothetical protein
MLFAIEPLPHLDFEIFKVSVALLPHVLEKRTKIICSRISPDVHADLKV